MYAHIVIELPLRTDNPGPEADREALKLAEGVADATQAFIVSATAVRHSEFLVSDDA